MDAAKLMSIMISMVFINNFILSKFLGLCPFIGVSRESKPAISMGLAVTFVMTIASIITWLIYRYLLVPFDITYMRTISFILVIASFVQFVEMAIRKTSPGLYKAFGIYLPLITVNCAVLGVAVLNSEAFFLNGYAVKGSFLMSVAQGFFAGIGYLLAMLLMSGIRERLELINVPKSLEGVPLAFIVAALMSLAFMGFSGFSR
ncbi:MAG: electron transport complex subunit RsxA [Omnitrophica WOR_2 bacterium GWF2_43_52]|nr:MAG: electron transport complex subunit RsxA [Omnitrophica WOR_2 bacterium GWC2_44_8]OGX22742.1 MAG: electron transport complex subunit RsxA [Omnitrophica WOR_2 bacterium GWF2_43_52]OGX55922.1 MAG: electron transport complex subunit RsxA [Omnitrophica WOR_2 bacterium RIFOXYC2_FULL_43_9]HAH19557.1 electron transport complex subunit RsxA [Candidatus Omnitrophota bacterium]HBG64371.1 electron transport complex subunit RsxA [Candidatus Omnitrophota bacterium]